MKKILLATTMIVGGASIAAADVTLSGSARMGVISDFGDDSVAANGDEGALGFTSRARVAFGMAGETDGGLSFGASFRADNADGANDGTAGSVFIQGAFGKLTMGDTDGAANAAVGQVDGVGLTGLSDTNELIYLGNGGLDTDDRFGTDLPGLTSDPTVRYEFTTGGLTLYASATQPNYIGEIDDPAPSVFFEGDAYALGAKYTIDAYTVALGYETLEFGEAGVATPLVDLEHIIVGGSATFSGVTVKANYGKADGTILGDAVDVDQYAVSATYAMDAFAVTAFLSDINATSVGVSVVDVRSIGLGGSYDLGGGAKIVGGVARVKELDANTGAFGTDTAYDLGVSFEF